MLGVNGVPNEPLVEGVVYCNNNAVYGYTTVAPIVNVINGSKDEEIILRYASRQQNLGQVVSGGAVNTVRVAPKGQALLVDLVPGALTGVVTYITVQKASQSGFDVYALVFTTSRGYYLMRAPAHFEIAEGDNRVSKVSDVPQTAVVPTKSVFPLEFCGCYKPDWPWALVYTATFFDRDPRVDRGPDCKALVDWAIA